MGYFVRTSGQRLKISENTVAGQYTVWCKILPKPGEKPRSVRYVNPPLLLLFLLPALWAAQEAAAQAFKRTAVTAYNVDDGLLQNSVVQVVVDTFGFAWFSSPAGVQRFDGHHFETVRLPEIKSSPNPAAGLAQLQNGAVWISHATGITAYDPFTNRYRHVYQTPPPLPNQLYQYLAEDDSTVWYLAQNRGFLQFNRHTGALLRTVLLPWPTTPLNPLYDCQPVNGNRAVMVFERSFAVFDAHKGGVVFYRDANRSVTGLILWDAQTIVYADASGYYKLNIRTGAERFFPAGDGRLAVAENSHFLRTPDGKLLLGRIKNLYELNPDDFTVTARWAPFNQDHLLNSGYISQKLYLDRFQRLWVLGNTDGVKRINLARPPFRYYGTAVKENNFVRGIWVGTEQDLVMGGTYEKGLLLFDKKGTPLHHTPKFKDGTDNVIAIEHLQGNDFLLLSYGPIPFHLFNTVTKKVRPVSLSTAAQPQVRSSYYGMLKKLPDGSLLLADHHLFRFRVKGTAVTDTAFLRPYHNELYNVCASRRGGYRIASANGLEWTDEDFKRKSFVPFNEPMRIRCTAEDERGHVWLGTESGLYKADSAGRVVKRYSAANGLTDEGIYAVQPVRGGIWFSHNKGLSFLSHGGKFQHYTRQAGLQENEFNSRSVFRTESGEVFFGGVNGITAFYPQEVKPLTTVPPVRITDLRVMDEPWRDTAVWNLQRLEVAHNEAHMAFRLGVPTAADNEGVAYEYRMEGLDPEWLTTSGADYIRYVLPPGDYTFRARAGEDGRQGSEARIRIHVSQPFWQRPAFRITAGVVAIALLFLAGYLYNRRRYGARIKRLEMERRLQAERERISRDLHDNLGAYASAIADNVDKLQKNGTDARRLRSLREASSEIMTNLRDTIWALNKSDINAVTLSDRIKSFLQKMRDAYPAVRLTMEETVDAKASLSPEAALNVLRIVQEAVHNAIRHSRGSEIVLALRIGKELRISIADNGIGLPPHAAEGYGLRNMSARAAEAKLRLRIKRRAERGTEIELSSPLQ